MQQRGRRAGETITDVAHQIGRRIATVLGDQLRRPAGLDTGAAEPWAYGIVGMVHLTGDWWVDRQTMSERAAGRLPHRPDLARPGRGARRRGVAP